MIENWIMAFSPGSGSYNGPAAANKRGAHNVSDTL